MNTNGYKYHFDNQDTWIECAGFSLNQYGELWCNPDSFIKPHDQWCHEITYIIDGTGTVTTGNNTYFVKSGDCVFSFPDEIHSIKSSTEEPLRFVFIGFNQSRVNASLSYLFDEIRRLFQKTNSHCVHIPDQYPLFVRLFTELKSENILRYELAGYLLAEFLISFVRIGTENPQSNHLHRITDDAVLVYGIKNYISNNIRHIQNLKDLETVFNYSYTYLSKRFFGIAKMHLYDYFIACKMKEANRLLAQGFKITEISEKLNYSSIHSFSRSYKKYFGYPPSERMTTGDKHK